METGFGPAAQWKPGLPHYTREDGFRARAEWQATSPETDPVPPAPRAEICYPLYQETASDAIRNFGFQQVPCEPFHVVFEAFPPGGRRSGVGNL
jgi:hypothetical protein